jgi:hypothetical protein
LVPVLASAQSKAPTKPSPGPLFNDCHFHLTNYVQKGTSVADYVKMMGTKVGRSTLFGIPLQQQWSYENTGDFAPTYYLQTDAPLYYYSFTDAYIAMAYRSLPTQDRDRLDPMITGFNPTDMYAADHIRRVLETFPGVFTGIGEFTIHKEFVSSKIPGDVASLTDPALDGIFKFAAEVGLVVLLHNDIDQPFAKAGAEPVYLAQIKALFARHPDNSIIWAHGGLGRIVHPVTNHVAMLESFLGDPAMRHVNLDISWDEVAKYLVATPETTKLAADLIRRFPDRFLFGTDVVAPADQQAMLAVYEKYAPLWAALDPPTVDKVSRLNYERIFDAGRKQVRAWEKTHLR